MTDASQQSPSVSSSIQHANSSHSGLPNEPLDTDLFQDRQPLYCYRIDDPESIEDVEQYRPGGWHPVMPGDFLGDDDRFDVWNKLGQGAFGIVWLCFDTEKDKFCAIKILRHDVSHREELPQELKLQQMLQGVLPDEAWEKHVAMPLEHFFTNGPNGRHLCIVMPVLGPDISASRIRHFNDLPFLKDICYQITEGMAFLHAHGLCHGDFRSANILFKTTLADLTTDEMERYMPRPKGEPIYKINSDSDVGPHAPAYVIYPLELTLQDRYITHDVAIIDFGVSFEISNPPKYTAVPVSWAAPETHVPINAAPGTGSDLWALGCTMAEVLCGQSPLRAWGSVPWRGLEEILGPVPEPYRSELIKNKMAAGHQEASDTSIPLMIPFDILQMDKAERKKRNGTEDMLFHIIGRKRDYGYHPDWDSAKERLEPKLGKGWYKPAADDEDEDEEDCTASPDSQDSEEKDMTESGNQAESGSVSEESVPQQLVRPIGISRQLDPSALPGALDLIRRVLRWLPKDRVPADHLLGHEWFEGRNARRTKPRADAALTQEQDDAKNKIYATPTSGLEGAGTKLDLVDAPVDEPERDGADNSRSISVFSSKPEAPGLFEWLTSGTWIWSWMRNENTRKDIH